MYVCAHMYVYMYIVCVCMYVLRMYVCACMYVCVHICMYIRTFVCMYVYMYVCTYTGCPRRNVKYFGRVFLELNYTDITQNTYIQS